jgi:hypothetical protein
MTGSDKTPNRSEHARRVIAASPVPMSFSAIAAASGLKRKDLGQMLHKMVLRGYIKRTGKPGRKDSHDGFLYAIGTIVPPVRVYGRTEEEKRQALRARQKVNRERRKLAAGKPGNEAREAAQALREKERHARRNAARMEARRAAGVPARAKRAVKSVSISPSIFQPAKVQRQAETVEQFEERGGRIETLPSFSAPAAYLPRRPVVQYGRNYQ